MIRAATGHINKIRLETIAINLAREGAEAVYARRNSNWLKRPDKKDAYRTCADIKDDWCNLWLQPFYQFGSKDHKVVRVLSYKSKNDDLGNVVVKEPFFSPIIYWNVETGEEPLKIFLKVDGIVWGNFYRYITIQGLYRKDETTNSDLWYWLDLSKSCHVQFGYEVATQVANLYWDPFEKKTYTYNGNKSSCADNSPKELIFCSVVEYEGHGTTKGKVELCSSITNYMK